MGIRLNPFTGQLDLVGSSGTPSGSDNFSYYEVPAFEIVIVPDGQQMLLTLDLMVRGDLIVRGFVNELPDDDNDFDWTLIPAGVAVKIPANHVMFYKSPFLNVQGDLRVLGDVIEV